MQAAIRKLFFHWIAIVLEILGTVAIFLETQRIEDRLPSNALGRLGDTEHFKAWFYHCGTVGIGLVFAGVIIQSIALAFDSYALYVSSRKVNP